MMMVVMMLRFVFLVCFKVNNFFVINNFFVVNSISVVVIAVEYTSGSHHAESEYRYYQYDSFG